MTYNKLTYGKDKDHDKDKKDCKDKHNSHSGGVIKANPQHVESEEEPQSSDEDAEAARAADDDAQWRDGYYCCAVCQAEEAEHFFRVEKIQGFRIENEMHDPFSEFWAGE